MSKKTTFESTDHGFSFPQFDMGSFTTRLKDAGLDAESLMESQRKNFAAVVEANRKAAEGYQALFTRQKGIFEETMAAVQEAVQDLMSANKGKDLPKSQSALIEKTIGKSLANMKELADLAMGANSAAYKVIQTRTQESIAEMQALTAKVMAGKK